MSELAPRRLVLRSVDGVPLDDIASALAADEASPLEVVTIQSSVDATSGKDDLAIALDDADRAVVVHVVGTASADLRESLVDLEESSWECVAEDPVWMLIDTLQVVAGNDSHVESVVVVTETTGLSGAAGATAASTAAEGARAVVKSAARAWGGDGPKLNLVAADARLLGVRGDDVPAVRIASRGEPTVEELAEAILAAAALPRGVGVATLIVDGGRTLLP